MLTVVSRNILALLVVATAITSGTASGAEPEYHDTASEPVRMVQSAERWRDQNRIYRQQKFGEAVESVLQAALVGGVAVLIYAVADTLLFSNSGAESSKASLQPLVESDQESRSVGLQLKFRF